VDSPEDGREGKVNGRGRGQLEMQTCKAGLHIHLLSSPWEKGGTCFPPPHPCDRCTGTRLHSPSLSHTHVPTSPPTIPPSTHTRPLPPSLPPTPQAVGGKTATVPVTMSKEGWPIVHGSVQMQDNTNYHQPLASGPALTFSTSASIDDKPSNIGVAQMLLTSMLGASNGGGLRSIADQASALLGFSLADANPVSIITDKRPDGTTLLWTSTIRNVIAYKVRVAPSLPPSLSPSFPPFLAPLHSNNPNPPFPPSLPPSLLGEHRRPRHSGGGGQVRPRLQLPFPRLLCLCGANQWGVALLYHRHRYPRRLHPGGREGGSEGEEGRGGDHPYGPLSLACLDQPGG